MRIVVFGGTGLIGAKTVAILRRGGYDVVAASPSSRAVIAHLSNGGWGSMKCIL